MPYLIRLSYCNWSGKVSSGLVPWYRVEISPFSLSLYFSMNMLVAKQLEKHASIYIIFGILHLYVHTLDIHIIILDCFHMYIHIGTRVHIHICVCV